MLRRSSTARRNRHQGWNPTNDSRRSCSSSCDVSPSKSASSSGGGRDTSSDSSSSSSSSSCLLWSGIARNTVLLVEAGSETDGSVAQTAQELLDKPATPGFEFHTQQNNATSRTLASSWSRTIAGIAGKGGDRLKGIKFHLYEHDPDTLCLSMPPNGEDTTTGLITWVYAVVYRPSSHCNHAKYSGLTTRQVQSWLEKMVVLTEHFRLHDDAWRNGGTLAAQTVFAPILLQRMQEVAYYGSMAVFEEWLESTKLLLQHNIEILLERDERIHELHQRASNLQEAADVFRKQTKRVRRMKMMQDAKYGLAIGAAVTIGVAIVVVPPLVAILG